MNQRSKERCDLFIGNRDLAQQGFTWDYSENQAMTAILCTAWNKDVDITLIRGCRRVIRNDMENFSYIQERVLLPAATMLALSIDSRQTFGGLKKLYLMLLEHGFKPSIYLMLGTLSVAKYMPENTFEAIVESAVAIKTKLSKDSWFKGLHLEDEVEEVIAVWTVSIGDADTYLSTAKKAWEYLKDQLTVSNMIHVINNNLFSRQKPEKLQSICEDIKEMYQIFSDMGFKLNQGLEDAPLTTLAILTQSPQKAVEDVLEVYKYLQQRLSFHGGHITREQYLLYAAALTEMEYIECMENGDYIHQHPGEAFSLLNISLTMTMAHHAGAFKSEENPNGVK